MNHPKRSNVTKKTLRALDEAELRLIQGAGPGQGIVKGGLVEDPSVSS